MANVLLTISFITREALRVLDNSLTATKRVNRQYDPKFGVEGAKIGTTLNIRKPPRYTVDTGQDLVIQDAVEEQVTLSLDKQAHTGLAFTSQDRALSIDDFSERFIQPAILSIANEIDKDVCGLYNEVYHNVGTPGTVPNDLLTYLDAGVKLDDSATPMDGERTMLLSPRMQATLVDALKGLFQASSQIAEQYRKGKMGITIGFEFFMDQNIRSHTVGPRGGTPVVNGPGQTGSTLITDGWTSAAAQRVARGDVFTLPSVNQVNPQNREDVGALQAFVCTSDGSSNASGQLTLNIDPPITPSGQRQTVTASPANDAALTFSGTASTAYRQGLAFHKNAFTLATADLPVPEDADMAAQASDPQLGISLRMVRAYDIFKDRFPCRIDVLYGRTALRPETASRIWGS